MSLAEADAEPEVPTGGGEDTSPWVTARRVAGRRRSGEPGCVSVGRYEETAGDSRQWCPSQCEDLA